MKTNFYSKADTLISLSGKLKKSFIGDIYVFTVEDWQISPGAVLESVKKRFCPNKIVIRSSSMMEDKESDSKAGCFYSQLGVDSRVTASISSAIDKVIESYGSLCNDLLKNQIMVQPYVDAVSVSGVVFTRHIGNNSPYYCINYDDISGKTDTVTGGKVGSLECIFRGANVSRDNRWHSLLEAVKEIESHFPSTTLDIEFAITKKGFVNIFQVRPLAANRNIALPDERHIDDLIESMKAKFRRFSRRVPHLAGEGTIFGDMPDWNPAEIIGSRPNTLDYTLYSFLFTDHAWHEARTSLGYSNVFPGELMTSFGKRPYIDVRLSFNSLTPAIVPARLKEKLISYYLDKLRLSPEKQDKVEFEILWTCYDFSLPRTVKVLNRNNFKAKETEMIVSSLRDLTNDILKKSRAIFKEDLAYTSLLTDRKQKIVKFASHRSVSAWDFFTDAYNMLQNCKKFGAQPFARLARLAFIAKSFLISMKNEGIISEDSYHAVLNSIETVASNFSADLKRMHEGRISKDLFFKKYGHLRPGTYDITAPRYDSVKSLFKGYDPSCERNKRSHICKKHAMSKKEMLCLDRHIKKHGLYGDSVFLMDFIKKAIEYREYSKFEFTKTLSDALEVIAQAGKCLGFSRSDLGDMDLNTIMKFRNPEYADTEYAKDVLAQSKERHYKERQWSNLLVLPPVITSESDFHHVISYESRPNFITDKMLRAPVLRFDRSLFLRSDKLSKHIVMLENADPGYDWIFSKKPLGIITKYGGVASHMAIRCAEFGIPAAIGCGESLYEKLAESKAVIIDCTKKMLKPLSL